MFRIISKSKEPHTEEDRYTTFDQALSHVENSLHPKSLIIVEAADNIEKYEDAKHVFYFSEPGNITMVAHNDCPINCVM